MRALRLVNNIVITLITRLLEYTGSPNLSRSDISDLRKINMNLIIFFPMFLIIAYTNQFISRVPHILIPMNISLSIIAFLIYNFHCAINVKKIIIEVFYIVFAFLFIMTAEDIKVEFIIIIVIFPLFSAMINGNIIASTLISIVLLIFFNLAFNTFGVEHYLFYTYGIEVSKNRLSHGQLYAYYMITIIIGFVFWATRQQLNKYMTGLEEKNKALQIQKKQNDSEMEMAKQIVTTIMEYTTKESSYCLDIWIDQKSQYTIGGDFFERGYVKDNPFIALFDITGHGVSSAMLISYFKFSFQYFLRLFDDAIKTVTAVNVNALSFMQKIEMYSTINFLEFDTLDEKLYYICEGGYGFIFKQKTESVEYFSDRNRFLGFWTGGYEAYTVSIAENDIIVIFTDGIIEAEYTMNNIGSFFPDIVKKNKDRSAKEITDEILKFINALKIKQTDDESIIVIKYLGDTVAEL